MLNESIYTSLVDKDNFSDSKFRHDLITNRDTKMISELKEMLNDCDEFLFSVAFITKSGVIAIKHELKNLLDSGIKGKIITGDYLGFTDPKALRELMCFKNIEIKMYSGQKLHSKGYFFKKANIWTMYIGSSNLTQSALTVNKEWNLKFSSNALGEIVFKALDEYNKLFNDCVAIKEVIDVYEEYYNEQRPRDVFKYKKEFTANKMQMEALRSIEASRSMKRGLLISATGTGKTVLSAFDVKKFNPKRMLYLVHQGNIAMKAMETFKSIIKNKDIGYYKEGDFDYLFMTIQTISRDENLVKYERNHFDYIIIDEVHRSGALSYNKVMNYFTPKYLLGMTATPKRTDAINIYELFYYNIVYEIMLYRALDEGMLCPFHYFGISDLVVDNQYIDDKTSFNNLVSFKRVNHILKNSKFYGYDGKFLSCLVFVSSQKEGIELERLFLQRGYSTIFLSGDDSIEKRQSAISSFECGLYNYIITVNIFNEGIDIACVNQIIMLRPTTSSIIYIQQLGRGLRKYKDKNYVVVLDFIANYKTSFLNAKALSQNNTGEKDSLLRFIINPNENLCGSSTITFDRVSKKVLYEQISNNNSKYKNQIKEDYIELCSRLNKKIFLYDFICHGFSSPSLIIKEYGSIKNFYFSMGVDITVDNRVEFLAKYYLCPKRVHEYAIICYLIENKCADIDELNSYIESKYGGVNQYDITYNALLHLTKGIFKSFSLYSEYDSVLLYDNGYYLSFVCDDYLLDVLRCQESYLSENNYFISGGLVVGAMYSKSESCLYGLVDYNNGYQVSGYNFYRGVNSVFAYINFDDLNSFTSYDNQFIDQSRIVYFSKSNRSLADKEKIESLIASNSVEIHLFGRKKVSKQFYYFGKVEKTISAKETQKGDGVKMKSIVKYVFMLEREVKKDIYDYLVDKND